MQDRLSTSRAKRQETALRRCHRCHGSGRAPCSICNGSGQVMKTRDVNGLPIFGRCDGCMGTRSARCSACGGERFL